MRFRKRPFALLSVFVMVATLSLLSPGTAHAAQVQVCGNNGTGYCLNDWGNGGLNNPVKMYWGNNSNEHFVAVLTSWCNNGHVRSDCPFQHASLNQQYDGANIVQIEYLNGYCIGTNANADAVLGLCPNANATPSNGTIMIEPRTPCGGGVGNGPSTYLVDRYWSDVAGSSSYLRSGGNPGVQAYYSGTPTCWGAG
jgi:hypothetical protein